MAKTTTRPLADTDLATPPPVRPLMEDAEYARLTARVGELRERLASAEKAAREAVAELDAVAQGDRADQHVADLLEAPDLPVRVGDDLRAARQRAEDADRAAALLRRAIAEGDSRLDYLRITLAPRHTADLRDWSKRLAVEVAKRLCDARRLLAPLTEAFAACEAEGISGDFLNAAFFVHVGRPGDDGALALWLEGLIADGVLTGREGWLCGSGAGDGDRLERDRRAEQRTRELEAYERGVRARDKANAEGTARLWAESH